MKPLGCILDALDRLLWRLPDYGRPKAGPKPLTAADLAVMRRHHAQVEPATEREAWDERAREALERDLLRFGVKVCGEPVDMTRVDDQLRLAEWLTAAEKAQREELERVYALQDRRTKV